MSEAVEGGRIFGVHAVSAALQDTASGIQELWLAGSTNKRLVALRRQALAGHITIIDTTHGALDEFSGGLRHQGVMAVLRAERQWQEQDLEQLLAQSREPPLLLALDGVQDPHNLGACLRTADAAGVQAVIAPRDRAVGLTPVVRKVASGAVEHVPFIQVTNLVRSLGKLKALGLWVTGTDSTAATSLFDCQLDGGQVLVMGAEAKGLRRLTRECCDRLVSIPMIGGMASLNVSVATGICLYEIRRQTGFAEKQRR